MGAQRFLQLSLLHMYFWELLSQGTKYKTIFTDLLIFAIHRLLIIAPNWLHLCSENSTIFCKLHLWVPVTGLCSHTILPHLVNLTLFAVGKFTHKKFLNSASKQYKTSQQASDCFPHAFYCLKNKIKKFWPPYEDNTENMWDCLSALSVSWNH